MRSPPKLLGGLLGVAVTLAAGGCGSTGDPAASSPRASQAPTTSAQTTPATSPIEIVRVFHRFEYYGACGNEIAQVGGRRFYPVLPDRPSEIDETLYQLENSAAAPSGLARVAPPGPGDDVGTMIVYTDGMARFESRSGRVIWLTDEEQQYSWVC